MHSKPADPMLVDTSHAQERFDFGQAGHINSDQLRTLRSLDEQFARSLTHTLSAWLRVNLSVTPLPSKQQSFQQFIEGTGGNYLLPVQLVDQHVRGALALQLRLVPEVVDLLLGGSGGVAALERELTEIEEAVLLSVLEIVVRELNTAWQYIGVRFEMQERERDGQERRLMTAPEKTICLRYEIGMPGATGELCFCFPVAAFNTSLRAFVATRDLPRHRLPEERDRVGRALRLAKLKAGLCFPPVRVSASQLQQLQPGSLLRLSQSQSVVAELRLSDTVLCPAQAVRLGERRAARVSVRPSSGTAGA